MIVFNYQDYEITTLIINSYVAMDIDDVTNNTIINIFALINGQI